MAYTDELRGAWNKLSEKNALWAVLSDKKDWDQEQFFNTGVQEIEEALKTAEAHKIKINFGRALDFGCGVGRLSKALGKHFKEVVGVDIAESMVEKAKQLSNSRNVRFEHISSGDLGSFKDQTFDFIYTDIVFQHMRNELAKKNLKHMYRLLKKDGVLIFQMPSKPAKTWKGLLIKSLPEQVLVSLRQGMEMHPIKKESLTVYLKKLGFEIVTIEKDKSHRHWDAYFYFVRKPQ
jgi:ubiquinone/menaquinone biosynthesis C-methylase UbiE